VDSDPSTHLQDFEPQLPIDAIIVMAAKDRCPGAEVLTPDPIDTASDRQPSANFCIIYHQE
jgi:hypothetical protein